MMEDDNTEGVVINTISNRTTYDTQCCSSEEISSWNRFLNVDLPVMMWIFIPPVVMVLGTFGNVMTIVIMRRMSQGQSSNTIYMYFTALAVSDTIILYAGMLTRWVFYLFHYRIKNNNIFFCKLLPFLVYSSCAMSPWLIASMTMQRVMSVLWSHHKSLSCSKRKVEVVIATIVVVSCALNGHRLFAYEWVKKHNATDAVCDLTNEDLFQFTFEVYPWIDFSLSSFIPFIILIVCNKVLLEKVIESVQVARVMTSGSGDQVNSRQKKASSLTVTLITVSMVFLLLSMPICIYLLVEAFMNTTEGLPFALCDLSYYTNSAINFYLYCLTGSRFRNEVKSLLCRQPQASKHQ